MFLKLMSFLIWGILLCLLLVFSLATTLWLDLNTLYTLLLWIILIVFIIVTRAVWLSLLRLYSDGKINRFLSYYRLNLMERVLLEQWKQGLAVMRHITRRKHALPWFLLTGKRCGKTTLVAGAGLPIVTVRSEHETVVPTRTLRWSFFKSLAFLDISSHFLLNRPAYERAWRRLIRWCCRQPPHGVVICVSASDLLSYDSLQLHLDARQIRAHIEPLTRALGRHLPLYILITGSDEIPGFSSWVAQLSAEQSQQALGYHWNRPPIMDGKDPACLNDLFASLYQGMGLARISMASSLTLHADVLAVMAFPEKIAQLQPALHHYLSSLAQPDTYFEPGILGGVWFTASESLSPHSSMRRSLFIHELVNHHLPVLSTYHRGIVSTPYRSYSRLRRFALLLTCLLALGSSAMMSSRLLVWQPKKISPEAIASLLERNETWHQAPWRYLPFIPLLERQHQWLESRLLEQIPHDQPDVSTQLSAYQQRVQSSVPAQQNLLIMQLAQAIVAKQQLQQGMLLVDTKYIEIPAELRLTGVNVTLSENTKWAFERAQLTHFPAKSPLPAMRQMLRMLVQADSQWQWLYTSDRRLEAIRAADIGFKSNKEEDLPGIWTLAGQDDIHARVALIVQALGEPLPALDAQLQRLPELRQAHWLQWLFTLSRPIFAPDSGQSWSSLLLAIDNNTSPGLRLAEVINSNLADINASQAQPWLRELRSLQQLQRQAIEDDFLGRIIRVDQGLRKQASHLLKTPNNTSALALTPQLASMWLAWRSSVRYAAAAALAAPDNSLSLVDGLFTQTDSSAINPVREMYSRFAQFRQGIAPSHGDYAINLVWKLYQSDADLLLAYAMHSAACDLQQRWQQQVLWPLNNNNQQPYPDDQPTLAMMRVQDFMYSTGKALFNMTEGRAEAASFQGQSLPLTPDFLNLVNHVLRPGDVLVTPLKQRSQTQDALARLAEQQKTLETQKNALESQTWDLSISTQPATVPSKARLMPIGTRLTLNCEAQSITLASMNFSEQSRFNWSPRRCQSVELVIMFPGFNLNYDYLGDAAWPNFVSDFAQGSHMFNADAFDDQKIQLHALGIKNILVRYQLSDAAPLLQAWNEWKQNNVKIAELTTQRTALQTVPSRLTGNLALLPTTVAQCYR